MSTPAVINLAQILGEVRIDTTLYLFSIYWLIHLYNDWEVIFSTVAIKIGYKP